MMPNYNPALVGQQGIPQQSLAPQGQVEHHQQPVAGVPSMEAARAWQQMQNQYQHQQAHLRQPGMGDMGGQGNNTQQVSPPLPLSDAACSLSSPSLHVCVLFVLSPIATSISPSSASSYFLNLCILRLPYLSFASPVLLMSSCGISILGRPINQRLTCSLPGP